MKKLYRNLKAWMLRMDRRQRDDGVTVVRSETPHTCPYCNEHYQGNFCPQCGMAPDVERLNKRSTLTSFLDIWNLGNSTIFRTMKHLLWRPGYMISDWLNGRRGLYFPPVLTLVTICFVYGLAMNLRGTSIGDTGSIYVTIHEKDTLITDKAVIDSMITARVQHDKAQPSDSIAKAESEEIDHELMELMTARSIVSINQFLKSFQEWEHDNYAYSLILGSISLILFMPIGFRRSPHRQRTTLLEFFYIQLYAASMIMLISTGWVLFTGEGPNELIDLYPIPNWISLPVLIRAFHQLFGFSVWGTTWRYLLVTTLNIVFIILISLLLFLAYIVGDSIVAGLAA